MNEAQRAGASTDALSLYFVVSAATVALPLHRLGPMWRATEPDRLGLVGALGCALCMGWVFRKSRAASRRSTRVRWCRR